MSRLSEISLEFKDRGGKKLRPRLCRAIFSCCRGQGNIEPICDAIECFHKASLIHDDIQDGDEIRYGRPTTWKEHGIAVAIAAGDWLVAHGYQLIAKSDFPQRAAMLEAVVDSHIGLCEGQGDDLLGLGDCVKATVEQYISTCARKTGEAFALAAELGALAAGVDAEAYRTYGLTYGILFQINDDLADGGDPDRLLPLKSEYETRLSALGLGTLAF